MQKDNKPTGPTYRYRPENSQEFIKQIENQPQPKRTCGSCVACCTGILYGEAYGHNFYPGKPCFFLNSENKNCSIYKDRPDEPCKSYVCAWLNENEFPIWMKPSESNVIITKRKIENIVFYDVIESGAKMDSSVLNWLFLWAVKNSKNIKYVIGGGLNFYGSLEFIELFQKNPKN